MFARAAAVLIADTLKEGSWGSHVRITPMFEPELHFWESDDFRVFQRGIWLPRGDGLRLEVQHSDASEYGWGGLLEAGVHFIPESGSRHPRLQQLALDIVRFCVENEAVLSSQWVPREFEVETDVLSKPDWRDFVNWCNWPFHLIGELPLFLEAERSAATLVVPMWCTQPWWLLLCPDGVHFADCVVQWTELETSRSTFLPGLGRANERGVGLPDFRVFVVRVSLDEREPAGLGPSRLSSKFWQGMQFSEVDPVEVELLADVQRSMTGTREPSTIGGYSRAFVRYQL
ncbi:hypothetical protein CYMTET_38851 [Cymbomonas tetramitiformis]|uniref:Uncharacterized protein n=1 Tax=Cymbomonas tetramitiformis TaxID=36881 RepID=A0AAE0CCY8_9CHLO|nr:hypothetical protein CYMTET_38851 [Cymbomonas tetramitiformis]